MVDRWFDVAQTVLDTPNAYAKSVAGAGAHAAEAYTEQAQKAAATVSGQAARLTDICEAPGPAPAGGPRLTGGPGAGLRAGGANPMLFQNAGMALDQRFQAAISYSQMSPPGSVDAGSCHEPAREPVMSGAAAATAVPDADARVL